MGELTAVLEDAMAQNVRFVELAIQKGNGH